MPCTGFKSALFLKRTWAHEYEHFQRCKSCMLNNGDSFWLLPWSGWASVRVCYLLAYELVWLCCGSNCTWNMLMQGGSCFSIWPAKQLTASPQIYSLHIEHYFDTTATQYHVYRTDFLCEGGWIMKTLHLYLGVHVTIIQFKVPFLRKIMSRTLLY
jgi:hypothetical protein